MNRHFLKILYYIHGIYSQLKQWFLELTKIKKIAVVIVTSVVLISIVRLLHKSDDSLEVNTSNRQVSLKIVSELSNTDSTLPLLGIVTSRNEATIRSEVGGKLNRVYKTLGDVVSAGEIIAEFENSGERAAVLQAEGSYDAAKASRDIAKINSGTTESSLVDAKNNSINIISNAFVTMDDSIRIKTDIAYINPRVSNVHFNVLVPDVNLTLSLESRRQSIESMLISRESRNKTLTLSSDLISELNKTQIELQTIKSYLDDLSTAYSKALPDNNFSQSQIDSNKITVGTARSAIITAIATVNSSKTSLNASIASQAIADKTTGTTDINVTSADANVKQALGVYNGAVSRLEKTVIRSPINGTLNSLSIKTGDFVSAFTPVAVVSNNNALEVLTYVTDNDSKRIQVGNEVSIDNGVKGVITKIASAIDPLNKKIEVRIGITDKLSTLVNGQSVSITIHKSKQAISATSGPIKIPLSALKLTPNGAYVFMVSATSSLVAVPIKEGAILGEEIQIISGLDGTEKIVTDARGLKENMVVTVKE